MISLSTILSLAASSVTKSDLPFGERMLIGLEVSLIGILTVFVVLIVIWGVLELSRIVFSVSNKPKQPKISESGKAPEADPASEADIVAAITAAIAAYEGTSPSSLRVVRFTRK